MSEAYEMYKNLDDENKSFTLTHCWTRLKDEDKWKARRQELLELQRSGGNKKKQKTRKDSSATNDQINITGEVTEPEAPNSEERKRPIGNKKAKEALRRGGGEASIEVFEKMWAKKEVFDMEKEKKKEERFNISVQLEKERLSNEKMIAEAKLLKEEKDIMLLDKSTLDPMQLRYIELKQKKIIDRMSNEN